MHCFFIFFSMRDPLLENRPKILAKNTSCCFNWYKCEASAPAATTASTRGLYEPGTGHWVPGRGMTRFQCFNMDTGSCDKPVPNGEGDKGTGLWHWPVPILQSLAPGHATTRCRLVPTAKALVGSMTWCRCATFCTGSLARTVPLVLTYKYPSPPPSKLP